jgi:hypothetical protein
MEYKSNYIPLYQYFIDKEEITNDKDTNNKDINDKNTNDKNTNDKNTNDKYTNDKDTNDKDTNDKDKHNKIIILDKIINKLSYLHNLDSTIKSKIIFFNDIKKEIYDKVITRKKSIDDFLNYFGTIQYVNDTKILSFDVVLEKCKNIIISYYNTLNNFEYNIIFGDCNFSNILINPDNIDDIIFIDPRGYFGDTSIYGLKEYDYSKILYAISGYDNFNSNFFNINNIDIESKSIKFEIKPININKKYINKYFNKVHKAFMIIHWLSLADYNKNNIWKCLASYYYGLYLGTLL